MSAERGVSLVELLAVLAIIGIGLGAASLYVSPMEAPLQTSVELFQGTLRAARLKALATTSACRVAPIDPTHVAVWVADHCSDTFWTADDRLELELPRDVVLTAVDWSVCYSGRGVADGNTVVGFSHPEHGSMGVEILLGGTTVVLP